MHTVRSVKIISGHWLVDLHRPSHAVQGAEREGERVSIRVRVMESESECVCVCVCLRAPVYVHAFFSFRNLSPTAFEAKCFRR